MTRRTPLWGLLLSWGCQLTGAFVALHISYAWWGLRGTTHHASLLSHKLSILAALRQKRDLGELGDLRVPVVVGACVEGGAAFLDVVLAGILAMGLALWKSRREGPNDYALHEAAVFSIRQATAFYLLYMGNFYVTYFA